jgi:hypothetical protein
LAKFPMEIGPGDESQPDRPAVAKEDSGVIPVHTRRGRKVTKKYRCGLGGAKLGLRRLRRGKRLSGLPDDTEVVPPFGRCVRRRDRMEGRPLCRPINRDEGVAAPNVACRPPRLPVSDFDHDRQGRLRATRASRSSRSASGSKKSNGNALPAGMRNLPIVACRHQKWSAMPPSSPASSSRRQQEQNAGQRVLTVVVFKSFCHG